MKTSFYNIMAVYNDSLLVSNPLSRQFVKFYGNDAILAKEILESNNIPSVDTELKKFMLDKGFIVAQEKNEVDEATVMVNRVRNNLGHLDLTLMPTILFSV